MKIAASILTLGMFLAFPGITLAQTEEKPKAEVKTETPKVIKGEQNKGMEEGKEDCSTCPDKQMIPASAKVKEVDLTKGMKLKDFTPISAILAAPEKFEGKRVLVKGPAVGVCESRGCWVNLKSEADAKKALRVKVEDGEIVFPMTVLGKEVQAEGVMEKMIIPVETLRASYKKQAEAKGQKFDPETVKEPRIIWQLKGLGAKFDAPKVEKTEPADKK